MPKTHQIILTLNSNTLETT